MPGRRKTSIKPFLQTSCRIADGKKAELSRHKTDMSWGTRKNTAEKAKVKSNSIQRKKSPCKKKRQSHLVKSKRKITLQKRRRKSYFAKKKRKITLLPNLLLATQVYSRPSALFTSLERQRCKN